MAAPIVPMDQWSVDEWTNRVDLPPSAGKAGQSMIHMVAGEKGHGAELRGQSLALRIENLKHLALVSKVRVLSRPCYLFFSILRPTACTPAPAESPIHPLCGAGMHGTRDSRGCRRQDPG